MVNGHERKPQINDGPLFWLKRDSSTRGILFFSERSLPAKHTTSVVSRHEPGEVGKKPSIA